ncbi:hypothetical protein ASPZODRAFT_66476 [Penicilliopsis zonata CBS 506.65]|uniref:Zn(2)-C6 fungal-type domain-containing protein n=1 Tax=Penicilliopsis zonata CBS 506.65 TaxID=1073090 RepID=A0A1L9SI25_9EURO|nr:hypothetical protein ASPZODRAFT_66476 [Penicilliopsis zonata CBS 506.65]OJJ46771.1 hypothetical protein ASPZODRAFT_66476 [Penicilliopsis zonata CBS 506.65]
MAQREEKIEFSAGQSIQGPSETPEKGSLTTEEQTDIGNDDLTGNDPPRKGPKKRTKTGCLTCRKRRIKCGEEKPICNNCVKSKRECEGYAPRVIFKNPIGIYGGFRAGSASSTQMQPIPLKVPISPNYGDQPSQPQQRPAAGLRQPTIAPRPIIPSMSIQPFDRGDQGTTATASFHYPLVHTFRPYASVPSPPAKDASPSSFQSVLNHDNVQPQLGSEQSTNPLHWHEAPLPSLQPFQYHAADQILRQNSGAVHSIPIVSLESEYATALSQGLPGPLLPPPPQSPWQFPPINNPPPRDERALLQAYTGHVPFSPASHDTYVDLESDEYYDVESDAEAAERTEAEKFNHLSLIMRSATSDEPQLRSFTVHLDEPNILASYRPTLGSSPLNNPKTARIFVHFLQSTGPSLSIFERHPSDSSVILGAPVPTTRQGLWTYTMPLKALEHQALLQAILAISSLHIAMLQQGPQTVSMKHYHFALKKVGAAVGLPTRRKQIGTLAATLVLGYYEVLAADHFKWNSHVAGSAQLVREIDFAGLTRDLRAQRRRVRAQREQRAQERSFFGSNFISYPSEDDPFAEKEATVDENVVGSIMGRAVNYDNFGQVDDGSTQSPPQKHFTRKDIDDYRIQCDLYWWYCKQDMIQSLISGNRLFTPYHQWGQCPPRAGIGHLDAIYGSSDHLILLLARLTDFGYRDRSRKLRLAKKTGVEWRPGPALFRYMARFAPGGRPFPPQGPPGSHQAHGGPVRPPPAGMFGMPESQRGTPGIREDSPPMYGMIPTRGSVQLPSAFQQSEDHDRPPVPPSMGEGQDQEDEEAAYTEAEDEWNSILAAFDSFAVALGRDFLPLPPDSTPPIPTPFGPALQYRTNTIAVVWGFYYAGRIILHRLHPSMPPAMMVASGVVAGVTAGYAQIIGKILAGIYYPQRYNLEIGTLSPTIGTSLTEMTVPIFFAAVQYTDAAQRAWTISILRDISRLTGWRSSHAIAAGCENAWVVAARKGRGPPYQPTEQDGLLQSSQRDTVFQRGRNDPSVAENSERRFIAVSRSMRLHWAMGILSLEDDILSLDMDDR